MPVVLLERLPLPSLRAYTSVSVLLLACAIYFAHQTVVDSETKNSTSSSPSYSDIVTDKPGYILEEVTEARNLFYEAIEIKPELLYQNDFSDIQEDETYIWGLVRVLIEEPWCVWVLINSAYCCLILFGKLIQQLVFGELRVSEQQHMKDKLWNFIFYKFIFVFGVMNVQNMDEVVLWWAWFSVLGALHLLAQLCKDRFEYLSFSPTTPKLTHAKVLFLLFGVQFICVLLTTFCVLRGYWYGDINTVAFMAAEVLLLMIKTLYVTLRYGIHLWDLNHDGVWENRALYVYYSELVFELGALCVDFVHHLHMLLWSNIILSMASLVICMQLRFLLHELQRRFRRHKNYRQVVSSMEARFPIATAEEIAKNSDDCAICWEKMDSARKLPCSHLFHNSCLRLWLEQDTSCPTCRTKFGETPAGENSRENEVPNAAGDATDEQQEVPANQQTTNHFFHFDGSRYINWLPSFSVEVTHTQLFGNRVDTAQAAQTSQLDNMARQVQEVFPGTPYEIIVDDLRMTRSVEITIENIVEGRLTVPQNHPLSGATEPQPPSGGGGDNAGPSTSAERNYTIMNDTVQHLLSNNDSSEDSAEDTPMVSAGSRFSKSPTERETMLSRRKESLLKNAKRRFQEKFTGAAPSEDNTQSSDPSSPNPSDDTDHYTSNHRRDIMFRAAQRRLNQH